MPNLFLPVSYTHLDVYKRQMQFDRMTEEDLLRGLEGLVPPADTEDDGD